MMPGFVDSHGHLSFVGFHACSANLLPEPDGEGNSFDDLIRITEEWISKNSRLIKKIGWICSFGYDDSQLK